eukprot:TRINITY_DN4881_c1_g1_i1.p1 TRINITY_DN4881_c1_g1~~TRINITY_DN4881_c1_g1_i1.p1  ORF type:complete len:292 (+),score=75.46 TRINITY_DN4881_c1_g1_i1:97-972(+)
MVFSIVPGRCLVKPSKRGVSGTVRAVATPTSRVFTDTEWEQAFKTAVDLKLAKDAAVEVVGETTTSVDKGDRLFSDDEWSSAITEALKEAAMSSQESESTETSPDVVPEGRVFSDRQWSESITTALAIREREQAAAEAGDEEGANQGDRVFSDMEWKVATKVALEMDLTDQEMETKQIMDKQVSMTQAMAFSGPAPETINGRLAMLGVVSALAAEAASGQSIGAQISVAPIPVAITFITFVVASIVPILKGTQEEAVGPFTPQAELLNGRLAMVGMLSLLVIETSKGGAFL